MTKHVTKKRVGLRIAVGIAIVLSVLFGGLAMVQGASAQTDYYPENETQEPNNETWMDGNENATIDSTVRMVTRVGTFVVGQEAGSGLGSLLVGLLVSGVTIGIIGSSVVGVVGGVVMGVVTIGAMASAGIAPQWVWGIVVFGIGILLSSMLIRIYR